MRTYLDRIFCLVLTSSEGCLKVKSWLTKGKFVNLGVVLILVSIMAGHNILLTNSVVA